MNGPAVIGVVLVAAFVQGACGFGYGLVAMAVLGLFLDLTEAAAYVVLGALAVNGVMLSRLWQHVHFRAHAVLVAGVLAGVPVGVLFLVRSSAWGLYLVLGLVLVGSTLHMAWRLWRRGTLAGSAWHSVYVGLPCGLFSGMLSGAFGTGGPPLVAYVTSQGYDRLGYAATVQALLTAGTLIRLEELLRHGILGAHMLPVASGVVLASGVGAYLGVVCLRRIPDRVFRPAILLFLFALGVRYILRGWPL
jgi:hypothetical protein